MFYQINSLTHMLKRNIIIMTENIITTMDTLAIATKLLRQHQCSIMLLHEAEHEDKVK